MESTKSPKRPTLRWDQYKREVLCCLYRFFKHDKKQVEEIFSYIFREHLNERGIRGFVPFSTLNTQWSWMKHERNPVWCHVHIDTAFDNHADWKEIITKIKSTAKILRFHLREKMEDSIDTTHDSSSSAKSKTIESIHSVAHHSPSESSESGQDIYQQSLLHDNSPEDNDSVVNSHGKVCLWCGHELTTGPPESIQRDQRHKDYGNGNKNEDNSDGEHQGVHHDSSDVGSALIWETLPRTSPRPYHTEGSVMIHTIAPGSSSHSFLRRMQMDQNGDKENSHNKPHNETLHDNQQDNQQHESGLEGVPTEKLPPLLYRWYDSNSHGFNSEDGFLAGMFCVSEFFDREEISDDLFLAYFRSHVTKKKSTTPFISSFRSPLAPIHRAIHSQDDAKVAVIDCSKLNTKVFYAHPLAKHTDTFTYSWRGYGEFLIWGRIPIEAVVFTLRVSELDQIAHSHKDINRLLQLPLIRKSFRCNEVLRDCLEANRKSAYKSGRTLGKLLTLLRFPHIHWENFARWFAQSWGWNRAEDSVQFMSGLRSELPYLDQELSDSENEGYLVSPHKTPQKLGTGREPHSPSRSDLNYEPPGSEENSDWSSERQALDTAETQSISMEDCSETIDDGRFSTHETLSSFGAWENLQFDDCGQETDSLPHTPRGHDEAYNDDHSQEWPSDGQMCSTTSRLFCVEIIRRLGNSTTS
ncbi:hypothetical protein N7457_003127 [Penicillium paradoxum]|uniref:uncharacterized protein n=1 Tax=Penicillium paradoxum TaxID=176176 RepID=UPI002546FBC1|nr:uncharacterized protein N7457_003127 [Penicillium paradoxum]KAJ5788137.1 hypothetical protein N7457_003127 [Penicillium paradoxum]